MMYETTPIFCPACDRLILEAPACPHCDWRRPPAVPPGEATAEPLPLGGAVAGRPALFPDTIWYATPPTERDTAGSLTLIRRDGTLVRRFPLPDLLPEDGGLPVATGVAGDGETLFVACLDYALGGNRPPKSIYALNPLTGHVRWRVATPSREVTAPVYRDGRLYAAAATPEAVYAVDTAVAEMRWRAELPVDFRYRPAVSQEQVIVSGGSFTGPGLLIGLDRENGKEIWRREAAHSFGQAAAAGDAVYVPGKRAIIALDAADGRERWVYDDLRRTSAGVATAPLTVSGDLLLIATGGGDRRAPAYALHAVARRSGERVWRFPVPAAAPGHILVQPVVLGETIIIGDRQGTVYALERATGALQWRADLARRLAAPPLAASDTLLAPTRDGLLHRLRWRKGAIRPPQPPQIYAARGEWETAAVAHALAHPPRYRAAGQLLLKAGQPEHARQLFRKAGDTLGEADALASLGRYDEAVALFPEGMLEAGQKADWLLLARRYDEAGDLFAELDLWDAAAAAYEEAGRPLKALAAYEKAGNERERRRLADRLDPSLLVDAGHLSPWQGRVEQYRRRGETAAAADLLEKHEQWEEALALRREMGQWNRVYELCRRLGDWRGEAAACAHLAEAAADPAERRRWGRRAGDLYAAHQAWADALACYRMIGRRLGQGEALVALGRYREAGDLLADPLEPYPMAAGRAYREAATRVNEQHPSARRDAEGAALFEQAAYWFAYAGDTEAARRCRLRADQCLNRPRLEVVEVHCDHPFQQGVSTPVQMVVRNIGAGPAAAIQLWAAGGALKRIEPRPAAPPHKWLAAGESLALAVSFEPQAYSNEEAPLDFRLWLRYRDPGAEDAAREDGDFTFYQPVYPNYLHQLPQSGSVTLHVHQQGSYYAGGDQVNVRRTAGERREGRLGMVINEPEQIELSKTKKAP